MIFISLIIFQCFRFHILPLFGLLKNFLYSALEICNNVFHYVHKSKVMRLRNGNPSSKLDTTYACSSFSTLYYF